MTKSEFREMEKAICTYRKKLIKELRVMINRRSSQNLLYGKVAASQYVPLRDNSEIAHKMSLETLITIYKKVVLVPEGVNLKNSIYKTMKDRAKGNY